MTTMEQTREAAATRAPGVRVYRQEDADLAALSGVPIAVVGYGNLGRSMALNLRDSGLDVRVGNVADAYREKAASDGFAVTSIAEAVAGAELVYLLVADEVIPDVVRNDLASTLRPGAAVVFASGYCLAFSLVELPEETDVILLAPRMLGEEVRRSYLSGEGYLSYLHVERDATGLAEARALALAAASGTLRRGALDLSARDEAVLDLLVEQTVGPYLGTAIQLAFALGVEAGLPPEALVLELYGSGEMSRTFAAFQRDGFYRSVNGHGAVATYGGFLRTLEVDVEAMRSHFRAIIEDLKNGGFARRLQEEHAAGYPTLATIERITGGGDPMTLAEERIRSALERPAAGSSPDADTPASPSGGA